MKIKNNPNLELKQYIKTHSFPFALNQDISDTYDDINEVTRRIITEDLELFKKHAKCWFTNNIPDSHISSNKKIRQNKKTPL